MLSHPRSSCYHDHITVRYCLIEQASQRSGRVRRSSCRQPVAPIIFVIVDVYGLLSVVVVLHELSSKRCQRNDGLRQQLIAVWIVKNNVRLRVTVFITANTLSFAELDNGCQALILACSASDKFPAGKRPVGVRIICSYLPVYVIALPFACPYVFLHLCGSLQPRLSLVALSLLLLLCRQQKKRQ